MIGLFLPQVVRAVADTDRGGLGILRFKELFKGNNAVVKLYPVLCN